MVRFMHFERTDQNMDTYIMEFAMLRDEAESRTVMASGFPGASVSVLRMQNAALTENEKTMVLASLENALAFPQVSAQTRRLFGPYSYASRQDVLVAQDMDTASEDEDCEAWLAYGKAKRANSEGGEPSRRANT